MRLGVIGDDFTGSSDVGLILAQGGMRTVQYVGVPGRAADADVDAGVVALKTRSVPPAEAVARSLEAFEWLRGQGCTQYLFKYCSTFDSTSEGNIGPVLDALIDALGIGASAPDGAAPVIVCPAFPKTGRTLYQGHLFVGDVLLSESGLEEHPLTPMTDPDLRRWLAPQTSRGVGHVPLATIRAGRAREALAAEAAAGRPLVLCDAVADSDLLALAEAAGDTPLISGGSGIALGLPMRHAAASEALPAERASRVGASAGAGESPWEAIGGPSLALSGSCSRATRGQIRRHAEAGGAQRRVDVVALLESGASGEGGVRGRRCAMHSPTPCRGRGSTRTSARSSTPRTIPSASPSCRKRFGTERSAAAIERFFGELATGAVAAGVTRLVSAGGETSGAVVSALGLEALGIGPMIDPGVPALRAEGAGGAYAVALKSGNFGAEDFFDKALAVMAG